MGPSRFSGVHEDALTSPELLSVLSSLPFNSPHLFPHVITTALLTSLVSVMAHVNILTRVAPTHSMFLYWCVAGRMVARADGLEDHGVGAALADPSNYTRAACSYLLAFNVMGAVMYTNYLPWV